MSVRPHLAEADRLLPAMLDRYVQTLAYAAEQGRDGEAWRARQGQRQRRRTVVPAEVLRVVEQAKAVGLDAAMAVGAQWHLSSSTAYRWIEQAKAEALV